MLQYIIPIGILVIAIFLVLLMWKKVPQDMAMVVTGMKKRVVSGAGTLVIPFFERVDYISLENIQVDVDSNSAITSTGVEIMIDGVAVVKVGADDAPDGEAKEKAILKAIEQFNIGKQDATITKMTKVVKDVLEGNMREAIATLTVEQIYRDRQAFLDEVKKSAMDDLSKMGLQIISINIKGLTDRNGYLEALGRPKIAEVLKNANIAEANAKKETDINTAEAVKLGEQAKIEAEAKVAEYTKEKALKVNHFKQETEQSKAIADLAYEIQANINKQEVVSTQKDIEITESKKKTELAEVQAIQRQKELMIEKILPAEKEREAKIINADAEAQSILRIAQARADALKLEADAKAKMIRETGEAEAEIMEQKADSYKKYNQAALVSMIIEKLPEMVRSAAEPISNIDKLVVIDSGQNGSGAGRLTQLVSNTFGETGEVLKAMTGIDLSELVRTAADKLGKPEESAKEEMGKTEDRKTSPING